MMNSYFDHGSAGFYNPAHQAAAAEAHQAAYRSFSQGLSLVPPTAPTAYQGSRSNSTSAPSDPTANYVDAACKLYDGSSAQSSAFKAECGLTKDQNGFKAPGVDQMTPTSAWNSAMRPSPSSVSMAGDPLGRFDAAAAAACSRSVTDAWSACCQSQSAAASAVGAPGNAFYPWMAIAGTYHSHL